jgi:hypothetical protein
MEHLTADLSYWIVERYAIKERREAGLPKPWSTDHIFQGVRFCNVHREDDAVTKWIRKNWNMGHHPAWMFVLARMFNLPATLEDITDKTDIIQFPENQPLDGLREGLKDRQFCGEKLFTSAYTISTCGKSMDKVDYVLDWVVQRTMDFEGHIDYTSCSTTWHSLTLIDGLGSFLAAQVVADMKNTDGHKLSTAQDWWTFSKSGPGSLRGLSWYFYGEPEKVRPPAYDQHLKGCREEVDPLIPAMIPRISDQDFQNCLCEFSKYMKVKKDNRAHVRNRFKGY